MTKARPRAGGDRGAAAVELTLLVPALVLVLGLMVAGGRLWFARTTVNEAAQTAARAGSLARSGEAARIAAREAGAQSMATAGLRCDSTSVVLATSAFSVPVGTPATVTSTVTCTLSLADVALPGLPGSVRLNARGAAALDTYRSRR